MPFHASYGGRVKSGRVAERADARKSRRLVDDEAVAVHSLEAART